MNYWELVLISLAPTAALWAAYPKRFWGAAALTAAAAAGSVIHFALAGPDQSRLSVLNFAWSLAACVYILYFSRGQAARETGREAELEAARQRRREAGEALKRVKAKGLEARREQVETQALYSVIKGLAESMTWGEIRPKIEVAVRQYLGAEDFAIYVADMREDAPLIPLVIKNLEGQAGGSWSTLSRLIQERGLTMKETHLLESPEKAVVVPIMEGTELLGYFYARVPAAADPGAFSAKARTFTYETAFAFRRVKLFQEVERLSRVDGLTGVYRRGAFDEKIEEETIRAKTFKTTFGLMLLDIDHFKELNDRYGHPFGDQVLRRVGEILNSLVYETDFVARYGGEEFVILLPRAEPAGTLRKAEAIRLAIENEPFAIALEKARVTVSIGIAHYPRDTDSPAALVAAADSAMYQAKSSGRNRVIDGAAQRQ